MLTQRLVVVPVVLVPVAAALVKVTAAVAAVQAALQTAVILSEAVLTTYEITCLVLEITEAMKNLSTNVLEKDIEKHIYHSISRKNFYFFHILQPL